VLTDFVDYLMEEIGEEEKPNELKPSAFARFVEGWCERTALGGMESPLGFVDISPAFSTRFPLGLRVSAHGIHGRPQLNGRLGLVCKHDVPRRRVGIEFAHPLGVLSLKPANVRVDPKALSDKLLRQIEQQRCKEYGKRR